MGGWDTAELGAPHKLMIINPRFIYFCSSFLPHHPESLLYRAPVRAAPTPKQSLSWTMMILSWLLLDE
jgi:hypothetical protein